MQASQECKHAFCTDCVTSSTRMHVAEGSVDRITCMEPGCSVALPRHVCAHPRVTSARHVVPYARHTCPGMDVRRW